MQQLIEVLIENYGFELNEETPEEVALRWLEEYDEHWIRLAIIEALYLGRYKSFSVEQILNLWCRRGQPKFHFTHEFERLICRRLPKALRQFSEKTEEEIRIASPELDDNPEEDEEIVNEEIAEEDEEEVNSPFSINRFTPLFDRSYFYAKLKAVAENEIN